MANLEGRVRVLEKVFIPPVDDKLSIRIGFGKFPDEFFTMDENGHLVKAEEPLPSNVIYISEEDALL